MKLVKISLALVMLVTLSCTNTNKTIMYIANKQVDCVGVAPQKCLQVKFDKQADWSFLYSKIKEFTYETGFYYKLEVTKESIPNPPTDASSIKYTLVEILEKSTSPIN